MHNLSMELFFNILFMTAFLCLVIWSFLRSKIKVRKALESSFNVLHFPSALNEKGFLGKELRVVKRAEPFLKQNYGDLYQISSRDHSPNDVYWYAVAKTGEFFAAIAILYMANGKVNVKWIIKNLSEPSMRGILCSDKKIYSQVFGEPHATYLEKRMGGDDDGRRFM